MLRLLMAECSPRRNSSWLMAWKSAVMMKIDSTCVRFIKFSDISVHPVLLVIPAFLSLRLKSLWQVGSSFWNPMKVCQMHFLHSRANLPISEKCIDKLYQNIDNLEAFFPSSKKYGSKFCSKRWTVKVEYKTHYLAAFVFTVETCIMRYCK